MEKLTILNSIAVPWLIPNIDTDIITPMKRMLSAPAELEKYAFEPYRFIGGNADTGSPNPAFPLNQKQYEHAKIMIVGENFGGGSSRETAPEAIAKMGYRCLIGSSFGGIFFKNCFQVGILPISLDKDVVERLAVQAETLGSFIVDLNKQQIMTPEGECIPFAVEPLRKTMLLEGQDDVGMTLRNKDDIDAFFKSDRTNRPWLY